MTPNFPTAIDKSARVIYNFVWNKKPRYYMDAFVKAFDTALNFIYDNVLSLAMLVLLIAVGLFLTVRLGGFQFRRFGYVMKNTVGSLFQKNLHIRDIPF